MTTLPEPSAWRYTHEESGRFIAYQYDTTRPKNCHHPNYTPMFTQGQLLQTVNALKAELDTLRANNRELSANVHTRQLNEYGQACFEEGRKSNPPLEPMTAVADRFAHILALELECVLADRPHYYDKAMQVLNEYRMAMNAIHEQHSPTFMGEPVLGGIEP